MASSTHIAPVRAISHPAVAENGALVDAERRRQLAAKAGLADFREWWRHAFGPHTPWGDEDSPVLLVAAETELERQLSSLIMKGGPKPAFRLFEAGDFVTRQGQPGETCFCYWTEYWESR
jgi:hypothetical protein